MANVTRTVSPLTTIAYIQPQVLPSCVAVSHVSGLARTEVLHVDIKYHVALYVLVSRWNFLSIL
jgi:hypothetical protein